MKKIDETHQRAVAVVEFYLKAKGLKLYESNPAFRFPPEFVKKHNLGTRSKPNTNHTFDIDAVGDTEILIEIDDYQKHSKKNQKINDGIINDFVENHLDDTYEFFRLQKEEIVNDKGILQEKAAEYLKEHLF